ncbi:DNA-binding transcriptional regulator, LysR family [Desulfocicer vacuolatum DSM 3385]|uniref:DNA-binding transcriptional regulator, LysR family n=1 Tax=Desulfocicer vacuolatum DSM 3385 TaxID=1121400 RepID=A0A1W2A4X7_9BACT|nr:LysR family transcriptional regulator [Desulfocicer vacuolatum]SMC55633.1 DNA-binding transcriptional regulator, LysR family [Desulfocicer vacuolatum DSM 3385]
MELTPDVLRTFVAAAQAGNFTQAAKQINISQSAVSLQMRKLEEDLGKPLFNRLTRGVQLTANGETLLKYARRLLLLHDKALASLSEPNLKGLIRLGAVEDYTDLHFPGILKRFSERYPLIQVDLLCDISEVLLKMFYSGKLDLCLRNAEGVEPGGVILREEPLIWVSSTEAEPEKRSPLPIAVFNNCIYRRWTEKVLKNEHIKFRVAYSSPSVSGVLAAVKAGLAVAPMGASINVSGLRVLPEDTLPALPSAVVTMHQAHTRKDSPLATLAQYITEEFRSMPLTGEGPCTQ